MINVFCVRPTRFNIGNEAISFAIRHLLKAAFKDSVNLVPVPAAEVDGQGWYSGLRARAVHEMNLYGHGVVVGGGNLYENGQLDIETQALAQLRPPLLLCGLSHGRIYDNRARLTSRTDAMADDLIVALNRAASRSMVRDDATLQHLQGLGLDDVKLGGCPTLLLGDMSRSDPGRTKTDGTLISIRNPELMSVPLSDQARVRTELERVVQAAVSRGLGPVRLLCHDKRDMAFAASLGDIEYIFPDDVETYFDLLKAASLVVCFRLHAFIPCLSFGVPAINLSYDERSISLVRTVGMGAWDIDFVQEPDVVGAVVDRIDHLDQYQHLVDRSRPVREAFASVLRQALDEFAGEVYAYAADQEPAPHPSLPA